MQLLVATHVSSVAWLQLFLVPFNFLREKKINYTSAKRLRRWLIIHSVLRPVQHNRDTVAKIVCFF